MFNHQYLKFNKILIFNVVKIFFRNYIYNTIMNNNILYIFKIIINNIYV